MRKELLKYLESIIYPVGSWNQAVYYIDEKENMVYLNLEDLQREFEKMLAELKR